LKKCRLYNPFEAKLIDPVQVREFFDGTDKRWKLYLSGGEPFIYPKYIELLKELTKKHIIVVYTNLSVSVDQLIKEINPEKVDFIYASLHLGERRKMDLSVEEFIEKVKKLEKAGFKTYSDYVLYPPLIKDYKDTLAKFEKEGLFIEGKVFRGMYEGKIYPNSFTEEERKDFLKYVPHEVDKGYSFEVPSFKGEMCSAGHNFFRIMPNGTLTRCPDYEFGALGNVFKGTFKPFSKIVPCGVNACNCNVAPKEGTVDFSKRNSNS
jgi:MoaA/NifB/PqqE/SkfB family radical SAM enzyme